jgi:hypothetical protein
MYNPEVKSRFMESISNKSEKDRFRYTFENIFESREVDTGRDLYEFDDEEIIDILNHYGSQSYSSSSAFARFLNTYFSWVKENGISNKPHKNFLASDIDLVGVMKGSFFGSLSDLSYSLRDYPASEGYYEQPVCYMLWEGIPMQEIATLKNEDVVIRDNEIVVMAKTKTFVISNPEIVKSISDFANTKIGHRKRGNNSKAFDARPVDFGYFIKSFVIDNFKGGTKPLVPRDIERRLSKSADSLEVNQKALLSEMVFKSGRFNALLKREKAGETIDKIAVSHEFNRTGTSKAHREFQEYKAYKEAYGSYRQ